MTEIIEMAAAAILNGRKETPKHTTLPDYAPLHVKKTFFVPQTLEPVTKGCIGYDFKFTMAEGAFTYSTPIIVSAATEGGAFKKMRKVAAQLVTYIQICNAYNVVVDKIVEIKAREVQ